LAIGVLTSGFQAGRELWGWKHWAGPSLSQERSLLAWTILFVALVIGWLVAISRPQNLVRNPRFREGTKYWGTGYVESLLTNGNWPMSTIQQLPLVLSGGAQATGRRDAAVSRSGRASFFIEHRSRKADHVWSSFSQLIAGLRRDTDYVAIYWVKGEGVHPKALFLTLDHRWAKPHRYAPDGTYAWHRVECPPFNTGSRDFVDFRFVMQAPGRVWIDDVALHERR
jgi:hypothetical protein